MSDLKENRELSRINQKKCKFCNCSNYVKPKYRSKEESTIVKIQSQNLVKEEPRSMSSKEN